MANGVTGQAGPLVAVLAGRRETGSAIILLLFMEEVPVLAVVRRQKFVQVQMIYKKDIK
jgi:hypothetical protein